MANSQTTQSPFTLESVFSKASRGAAMAGAVGGVLSFPIGEIIAISTGANQASSTLLQALVAVSIWSGVVGTIIGAVILVYDNMQSLRGQWSRDLGLALPLFFALSFTSGVAAQLLYAFNESSLTRGMAWALMGLGIGAGIGVLRRDKVQSLRGAAGGAAGGFIGGLIFDALGSISSAGGGAFSRFVGQVLMAALIGLLMRVVQDALKSAWLLGISSGPYEGKEYPLNKARVTVGRSDGNDICLYREETVPVQMGALVFGSGAWFWQGETISINGVPQNAATLQPGDTLQMGATRFRFQTRSFKTPNANPYTAAPYPAVPYPAPINAPQPAQSWSAMPPQAPVYAAGPLGLMADSGQTVRFSGPHAQLTLGRASHNQIVLADAGVSSNHARFDVAPGTLVVTDVGSTNGTWVNGARLAPQVPRPLQSGDRIRFGTLEYTVQPLP